MQAGYGTCLCRPVKNPTALWVVRGGRGSYIRLVMRTLILLLTMALSMSVALGCNTIDRDNPVDPNASSGNVGQGAGLSLIVPLPKTLATVVDSLVARLTGPDIVTVIKPLDYPSPLGPATLTIGAVSPGSDRTLTIEGYDLSGRLILSGERSNITIVTGDTTRITIDLRLTIDPSELDTPDTTAAGGDTTATDPDPEIPDTEIPDPDAEVPEDTTETSPEDSTETG